MKITNLECHEVSYELIRKTQGGKLELFYFFIEGEGGSWMRKL